MKELIVKALLHLKRKDSLLANTPTCPECGPHAPVLQIELRNYINQIPAEWRCRVCKTSFYYEPATEKEVDED